MYAELARPYVEEVKRNRWMGRLLERPILNRNAEPIRGTNNSQHGNLLISQTRR